MARTNVQTKHADMGKKVAIGAGIAALAAGAYFFLGPDGKKHQKKMKGWMVKMKGDVLERLETMEEVTQPIYDDVVDTVSKTYAVANKIPKDEIIDLAAELKKHWKTISQGGGRKRRAPTKKTIRRKSSGRRS